MIGQTLLQTRRWDGCGIFMGLEPRGQAGGREADSESGVGLAEPELQTERFLKEPPQFAVLLINDDYTTMEFVVEVLQKFFRKSAEEAVEITLKVHHEGRGVAGIYSHQIAETKAAQVIEYARSRQFPLQATLEPV